MSQQAPGRSAYTPIKQQHFARIVRTQMAIVKNICHRQGRAEWFRYLDLYAGAGGDEISGPGSPLCVIEAASELSCGLHALFCEQVPEHCERLHAGIELDGHLGGIASTPDIFDWCPGEYCVWERPWAHVELRCTDWRQAAVTPDQDALGLIYADPNGIPNAPSLTRVADAFPRMDMLINVPAAAYKRQLAWARRHNPARYDTKPRLEHLIAQLPKAHWFIRDLVGPWQWVFLFGTNWAKHPGQSKIGLVPWDSPKGQRIWERACLTEEEQSRLVPPGQQSLFEEV
jgi:hypothetical protein